MIGSRAGVRRGWTPVVVLLIGLTSLVLLFWVARLGEIQRENFLAVDALDDLHIHIATFHIRLEEHLGGDTIDGLGPVWKAWGRAARTIDAIRHGGLDDHDKPLLPLRQAEHVVSATQISSAMSALRESVAERLERSRSGGADPAVERRFHDGYQSVVAEIEDLEDRLEADSSNQHLRSTRLIRAVSATWVLIVLVSTAGLFRSELHRKRSEADLLSSRLLQAQEFERRRIAMELHDALGQALSLMKLQVRIVERGLGEGQAGAREECERLLGTIDHVVADVRRLSLNLSPTVLEDLGLTAALQWLIAGFAQNLAVQVTSDLAQVDELFPAHSRIVVYRVIQEALTNIARHARAEHAAVTVRRDGRKVTFTVEDDGVGFDAEHKLQNSPPETGFGLTTMDERVRMIGGRLELWSRLGHGTRVTFSVPVETGGP